MDLKTKRIVLKTFYGFIRMVFAIAGEEGIRLVEQAFDEWRETKTPKPKTSRKRARRKNS